MEKLQLNQETIKIEKAKQDVLTYTIWKILPKKGLLDLPWQVKLQILQITPDSVLKKWPQGLYVPIGYIERCLNFVSNFQRWVEVKREQYKTKETKTGKIVHDARVLWHFYIVIDWVRIERSCYGSRQMYDNPASSDFSVIEAARSIATKSFADTLGIASDKLELENEKLQKRRKDAEASVIDDNAFDWFSK